MSTSLIDSYSQSGPVGSTEYNAEFCWKPASKPECTDTGRASEQRRNNPHPSQDFMVWRLPRNARPRYEYVAFPSKCLPSEGAIHEALREQYCSTYTCDFLGKAQGHDDIEKAHEQLPPLQHRHRMEGSLSPENETTGSFQEPKHRDPHVASCGIGPVVSDSAAVTFSDHVFVAPQV
ncbi:unnamed protein product [Menidia menidia]|uniref:(Atlantic silverside) hypothetical protein n=1 Tax=Menidia menidia TaxID=238744 RepID=A0A8S4BNW2_9TELE|nr:unnamed protein product [Menidia menidia]